MRHFFQIIASFLTFTFHNVVYLRVWGVVGSLTITSLDVYCCVRRWKNFENRSIYGKVMGKSRVSYFFWLTKYISPGPLPPNDDYLIVCDFILRNIYQLKLDSPDVRAISVNLCHPASLAFDPSTNDLYMTCWEEIHDSGGQHEYLIRKITFDGKTNQVLYHAPPCTFARNRFYICIN